MILDYAENIVQLSAALIALLVSLFRYISQKRKGWLYAVIFNLGFLSSSYYWTIYWLIMGDSPNVSEILTYFGWDVAFLVLLMLVWHVKSPEERRYFNPLMLLPIPLNIWQLTLYLPYGGEINSTYQVTVLTGVACLSIQSICWYVKKRKDGLQVPWVAIVALVYTTLEFGMWTSTSWWVGPEADAVYPIYDLYYPLSVLCSAGIVFMNWALARWYRPEGRKEEDPMDRRIKRVLKLSFLVVMLVCCVGGALLGIWMRNMLTAEGDTNGTGAYDIIPIVLFMITMFLVAFAISILFIVNFREKAVENGRLREARRIAEHSNEVKSEFLANMSHEIRTPINAVLGMNEMILRESLQARDELPAGREAIRGVFRDISYYAGNIESAGNSLLSIINDILDFSRIEAGKLEITNTNYQLSSVLNDISNVISFRTQAKSLEFRIDVDETLPEGLCGDEVRVRQIMANLLNNAVKYTDRGRIRLAVSRESTDVIEKGGTVHLLVRVEDTGIGIRQEDLGRLFKKFERMELERNSTVEGSGLGLAITQSLLEMMGGSVSVESVYGEGSVFTATIPQQIVSCEPVGNFRRKFEKSIQNTTVRRESFHAPEARILIVDDTKQNIIVVRGLLKKTEMAMDEAVSGEEAVERARTVSYDVILMDQRMPKMDGTEALRRIREQPGGANRQTPVICLTADAVSGARERYLAQGFTDYLTKPIDSSALEQILTTYLPKEKVLFQTEDENGSARKNSGPENMGEDGSLIRIPGVDPAAGMPYCGNDGAIYRAALQEYARSAGTRIPEIRKYYEAQDWKNYGILVHALKSTSRTIGAAELSEIAAGLETAANDGREDVIRTGHEEMMAQYALLAGAIRQALGTEEEPPDGTTGEDEILEFMPEGE